MTLRLPAASVAVLAGLTLAAPTAAAGAAKVDSDGDGLSDRTEAENTRTNPHRRDTDGDGRGDGADLYVHATPDLFPAFKPSVRDYVVRCSSADGVLVWIAAPRGTLVSVDGARKRGGAFRPRRPLAPGQRLSFSVESSGRSRTYHVRCLPPDFLRSTFTRSGRPSHAFYIVTASSWVVVYDENGVPVWWVKPGTPIAQDAELLDDATIGWFAAPHWWGGSPGFEVHRLDGSLVTTVRSRSAPGEDPSTDIHDVQRLPNGDYLLIKNRLRAGKVDLTPCGGPAEARVIDGEIQRIRPGRAGPVWTWNSRDHIAVTESSRWCPDVDIVPLPDGTLAHDLVHLNSLQLVRGAVIVSTRHTDAVYKIDYASKRIVWKLGGTPTMKSLRMVGDSAASRSFGGPHFARELADGSIALHDNGTARARPPRAVRYTIDETAQTATLVERIVDPLVSRSICCGSAQSLSGGGWLMSWGGAPIITEFRPDGRRRFRLTLRPREYSYRVFPVPRGKLSRRALRAGMDAMHPRG